MTSSAIDQAALNELFNNQQKLDNLFSSMFDEEVLIKESSYDAPIIASPTEEEKPTYSASYSEQTEKTRHPLFIILPVILEIFIIAAGIFYFS